MESLKDIKLKDTSDVFIDGDWIEKKDQSDEGILLIQTGNVGIINYKDKEKKRYITEETFNRLNCTEVLTNDILISRLPDPIGRSCIVPELKLKCITAVDCTIFRPRKDFDRRYVNYILNSREAREQVYKQITGSSRKRISRKNLEKIELPIPCKNNQPDLAEQKKISGKIGELFIEIDKAINQTKISLENSNKLLDSKLKDFFENQHGDFLKMTLEELTEKVKAGGTPNTSNKRFWGGNIPFVKISDITYADKFLKETKLRITEEGLNNSSSWLVPSGAMILSMYGTVGRVVITIFPVAITQNMAGIIPAKDVSISYLYYGFRYIEKNKLKEHLKLSVHQHFGTGEAKKIQIIIPVKNDKLDFLKQEEIAKELEGFEDETNKLQQKYQGQLNNFNKLKQSILSQAFQGKL